MPRLWTICRTMFLLILARGAWGCLRLHYRKYNLWNLLNSGLERGGKSKVKIRSLNLIKEMLRCFNHLRTANRNVTFRCKINGLHKLYHTRKRVAQRRGYELRPTVRIRRVRATDAPVVVNLLKHNFYKSEPLAGALQMVNRRYSPALEELWRKSIDDGMSFIATPSRVCNKNMFGAIINTKLCCWDPGHLEKLGACVLCSRTQDLLSLWAFFIKQSDIFFRFQDPKLFNIAHIVVDEARTRQISPLLTAEKIGCILLDKSFEYAYKRGFNLACLISTGEATAKLANQTKMELIWRFPYNRLLNEKLQPILKLKSPNQLVRIFVKHL